MALVVPDPPSTVMAVSDLSWGAADLATLYTEHGPRLLRLAGILVRDAGAAEDIVQEAFVRLAVAGRRLRDPDRAGAYLRTTVVNLCRNRWRHRSVVERHPPEPPPSSVSAEDDALSSSEQRQVVDAVRSLPTRQRECLVLRYWMGLSESEIAATLGIAGGSVKTHMKRGLGAIERRLRSAGHGEDAAHD